MNRSKIQTSGDLGKAIRTRRREAKLSIATLAAMLGCSPRFLSEVERGKETASMGRVIEIACALGLELHIATKS